MTEYVAYYRVSTKMQGRSGLGLQAQEDAVKTFLSGAEPLAAFREVESGRRKTRPELTKALEFASSQKATLVVAKLDRLARNAKFLLEIVESGVEVAFCDLPMMPPGPMSKFFVTMMAAVAELESGMISDRTKAALKAAKSNGVKLGTSGMERAAVNRHGALQRAKRLKPVVIRAQRAGCETLSDIACYLNKDELGSQLATNWSPTTVGRLMKRLEV